MRASFSMPRFTPLLLLASSSLVAAQNTCYFGKGAQFRGPTNLVPCLGTGQSACCLLGDTCLSGNACYNYATGDTYQYGCTDIDYEDESCPFKCGWDPKKSPWTALEYCQDIPHVSGTWTCQSPESCGCSWSPNYGLLQLEARGCAAMGSEARVALYAPPALAPYVSLPNTQGGSTGYYSPTTISGTSTWISTAIDSYTPSSIGPLTTYSNLPNSVIQIDANQSPDPATYDPAVPLSVTPTPPSSPVSTYSSSPTSSAPSHRSHSTSTPTTSPTSNGASTSTTSTSPTSTHHGSGGLSSAGKIGVGVGVGVGAGIFLTALAIFFFLLGRRRRHPEERDHLNREKSPAWQQSHPDGEQGSTSPPPAPYDPGAGYPYDPSNAFRGPFIHEAPTPPLGASATSPRSNHSYSNSQPFKSAVPPMELPGDEPAREMDSTPAGTPQGSPAPAYREPNR